MYEVQSYWDKIKKAPRQMTIKVIGSAVSQNPIELKTLKELFGLSPKCFDCGSEVSLIIDTTIHRLSCYSCLVEIKPSATLSVAEFEY